ncbi:MAG: RNA-guided pseudouridylation complex pseudouridine synthase subunit Cbf5 [Nanoarchaeota archaeon]
MEDLLPFEKTEREIVVKKEGRTNPEFGKEPSKRLVNELIHYGIVNINKNQGPTSHQISDYVQKIFGINKAGHSGTLDPNVTGCLPIALDKATRIVQTLLTAGKEYVGIMHLHKEISLDEIEKTLKEFTGKINQLPPRKSAVKRQIRQREIYYFNILEVDGKDVLFKVGCAAGTYIRKLCDDFGRKIGTGAHMQELIRTKAGPFSINDSCTLHDLKDAFTLYEKEGKEEELKKLILPVEKGVEHLNKIWIFDGAVNNLCHGADLYSPGVSKLNRNIQANELVAVMSLKDELICLGITEVNTDRILEKGLIVKTKKVFMERNIYQ